MVATLERNLARVLDRTGFDRWSNLLFELKDWMKSRQDLIRESYLVREEGDMTWYVVSKALAYDYDLNKELSQCSSNLIRMGFPIRALLLTGSANALLPTEGLILTPQGLVDTRA